MNGRIYDGALGRFVQADPIIQDPMRVQSLNRYSYVWNNPLNATDPSGFVTVTDCGVNCFSFRASYFGEDITGAAFGGGSFKATPATTKNLRGSVEIKPGNDLSQTATAANAATGTQPRQQTSTTQNQDANNSNAAQEVEITGYKNKVPSNQNVNSRSAWGAVARMTFFTVLTAFGSSDPGQVMADVMADAAGGISPARAQSEVISDAASEVNQYTNGAAGSVDKTTLAVIAAVSVVAAVSTKKGKLWSSTKNKSSVENAFDHFQKHKSEFPEFQNAKQYAEGTIKFLNSPPNGTLTKINSRGDTLKYDPASNTFGVLSQDGVPRTMFRPKDGMDYWNKQ